MKNSAFVIFALLLGYLNMSASAVKVGEEYFKNLVGEYVVQDGIYYRIDVPFTYIPSSYFRNIVSQYENICFVAAHPEGYSGNVVVPSSIEYNGATYTVVGVYPTEVQEWYSSYPNQIYTFDDCSLLRSIVLPETLVYSRSGFSGCTALESIIIPDEMIPIWTKSLFDTAWYKAQPNGDVYLGKIYVGFKGGIEDPDEISIKEGTVSIGSGACSGMLGLKKLSLPNSVKFIGEFGLNEISISSIILPESLKILFTYSISSDNLTSLTIPNSIEEIQDYAFYDDKNLTKIYFPQKYFDCSYSSFPYAWYSTMQDGHIIIGDGIYLGYKGNLRSGVIFDVPTNVKYLASDSFRYSYGRNSYGNITELILPDSLKGIGYCTFYDLNIKQLSVPEGIESLYWTINSCRLKSLELPSSLQYVDVLFYNNNNNCKDIYCKAEKVPIVKTYLFDKKWDPAVFQTCTLHVPIQSLEDYRNDKHWGQFENIVGDISGVDSVSDEDNPKIKIYDLNGIFLFEGSKEEMRQKFTKKGLFIIKSKTESKVVALGC